MRGVLGLAVAALAVAGASKAGAQEPMRKDCLDSVISVSRLAFDHDEHRLWYRRFWTGRCDGLSKLPPPFGHGCSESSPGWNEIVKQIVGQGPPERAPELAAKICRLGELIGYEWAKDNDKRCIHTTGATSLSSLMPILQERGEVFGRLDRVEAKAKSMCAALRAPVARR
jgi:hypothetical protein